MNNLGTEKKHEMLRSEESKMVTQILSILGILSVLGVLGILGVLDVLSTQYPQRS
jgi:hypothetical protein